MQVALTDRGIVLSCPTGVESIPLGTFYVEINPSLFIPAGYDIVPQVAPDVLHQALQGVSGMRIFLDANTKAFGIESSAFANLETQLLEVGAVGAARRRRNCARARREAHRHSSRRSGRVLHERHSSPRGP